MRTTPSGSLSSIVSPVIEPRSPPAPGLPSFARRAPSLQSCARDFDQRSERSRIFHGQIREHSPVDVDLCQLQPVDQSVVRQPVLARGGVDARDPEPTEVALTLPAVVVRVPKGMQNLFACGPVEPAAGAPIAGRTLEDGPAFLPSGDASFHPSHGSASQQAARARAIGPGDDDGTAQATLPLRRLLLEDVAEVRLLTDDLAAPRAAQSLRGGTVGLHLRHRVTPLQLSRVSTPRASAARPRSSCSGRRASAAFPRARSAPDRRPAGRGSWRRAPYGPSLSRGT